MKTWQLILGTPVVACVLFFAGYGLARWVERAHDLVVLERPAVQRQLQVKPGPVQRYGFEGVAPRGGRVR
jgi:hypothetical protein